MKSGNRNLFFLILPVLILLLSASPASVFAQTCTDVDGDGYGLNGDASCPNGGVDCDDNNITVYPGAPLKCDGLDNNCDGYKDFLTDEDKDGDGEPWCAGDCDDNNPNRSHNIVEGPFGDPKCSDFVDNDCDNKVDVADIECQDICNDPDGDGYGSPGHTSCPNGNATDCNNNNPAIYPFAPDALCNGVDNNCSGTADDEYVPSPTNCGVGECAASGQLECQSGVEVDTCVAGSPVDESPIGSPECSDGLDNDCDGLTDQEPGIEDPGCAPCTDNDGDGYGSNGDVTCANGTEIDCNDDDAAINPGGDDANCNGIDEDCVGGADSGYVATPTNCGLGACFTGGLLDCQGGITVDTCVPLAAGTEGPFPGPTCSDVIDNDCDGLTDAADVDCSSLDSDDDGDTFTENQGDCDDTNITVYPGAPLKCDGLDNNCDGFKDFLTDEDKDGDGVTWCKDWQTGLSDCNDNNPNRFPGNLEGPFGDATCSDGIDNDCDNKVDGSDTGCDSNCNDDDGDGYGLFGNVTCPNAGADCNDNNPAINPGGDDVNCNGIDEDCVGGADSGYVVTPTNCGTGECASSGQLECQSGAEVDTCAAGTPVAESPIGSPECGDGLDNDCDGLTDVGDPGCAACTDNDADGYGSNGDVSCANGTEIDCNDNDAAINPGASDANCNGIDEDCVGGVDSGYVAPPTNCGEGACATSGLLECQSGVPVDTCAPLAAGTEGPFPGPTCSDAIDNDCDGFTDGVDSDCSSLDSDDDGDGLTENQGDCDDNNNTVYPFAPLKCDGLDNNCDGYKDFLTDEDKDGDGVTWCTHWQTGLTDCNDNDPNRFPGNQEGPFGDATCSDGVDNDCDSKVDTSDSDCVDNCIDNDGDLYGAFGNAACTNAGVDCNDNDPAINPGGTDTVCDGIDGNCSGTADDQYVPSPTNCGVGECAAAGQLECQGGVPADTCLPGTPVAESPIGSPECGDGLDNDCDGFTDVADTGCAACTDNDGDGYGSNGDVTCANGTAIDCNDNDAAINPGASDANCDTVDDNCSGTPDDEYVTTPTSCGTGECASSGQIECQTGVEVDTCSIGTPVPENTPNIGVCIDGLDNDCDGLIDQVTGIADPDCSSLDSDDDGDGLTENQGDCDDTDPLVFPGAPIICDGKDNNCDGNKDFLTDEDKDADGVPWCAGDCNDNDPARSPNNPEGPRTDATCSDGIDNNCDNYIDTADPGCAPPSCNTRFTPQDGPHIFDLLDPANNDAVIATACSWCHTDTLLGAGTIDQRFECERCHADPAWGGSNDGILKDPTDPNAFPLDPPYGFGTALNIRQHSSTVLGTTYGNWNIDCMTCHNPHQQEQNNTYGTSYGKIIKEYICYDNPVTALSIQEIIEFTASSGPGSYADGPPHNENICEMCHTQTNFHRRDGSTVAHHDNGDCVSCHQHSDAFAAPLSLPTPDAPHDTQEFLDNCLYCHINNTDYTSPIADSKCDQCHTPAGSLKGSFPTAVDVLGHTDAYGSGSYNYTNTCVDCHNPMDPQANLKHVRASIPSSIIPGSNILFSTYSGAGSFADGGAYNENLCDTCHSQTKHHQSDGTAPAGQGHEDGMDCRTCHAHDNAFMPVGAPADTPHDTITDCSICHTATFYTDPVPNASCDKCHTAAGSLKGSYPTAPDVITHNSGECVECHDPMNPQTNLKHVRSTITGSITPATITFTAYSGAGSFADGAPYEENLCDTCHSTANHHQSDGTAPGGQSHNDSADCRTCHAHTDGFSPDAVYTTISAPHDSIADCTYCHVGTTYTAAIPDSKCNQCHTAGGSLKGSYPTAQDVLGHTDANGSGSYTYTNACVDCHNPMYAQTNLKHVRSTLAGSIIPATITFTAYSGAGSFADGAPYEENLCDTCHSLTLSHQADGTAPGGQDHNINQNCTVCHPHSDAYLPSLAPTADAPHDTITDCFFCHTGGTFIDPIPNAQCEQCHTSGGALKGSYPTAPDVATHQSSNCVDCHDPMNPQLNIKHVRSDIPGAIFHPAMLILTAYSGIDSFADGTPFIENVCDACHSNTNHHQWDGTAPGGQSHKDGQDCRTCHAHIDGYSPDPALSVVSAPHNGILCEYCHVGTDYEAAIPDSKCDVCHTPGGSLKPSYPTAQDVLSHTAANGTGSYSYTITCVDCHDPMYDQTNLMHVRSTLADSVIPATITFTSLTGAGSFSDGAPYEENICDTCHSQTTHHQADGTAPGGQSHNDSQDCTTCHGHDTAFIQPTILADAPHDGITQCTYCHVGGNFTDPIPNSQCEQCHTPGGALKGSYPTAWDVATHQGRECVECHDPMNVQTNIKHVRSTIAGSIIPATVTFTALTGAGSFADGPAYEENVCDTCHSATNHHQSDGVSPGGQSHNDSTDCRVCHAHIDGFSTDAALITVSAPHDTVADCSYCHVGTVYETVIPDSQCEQCHTAAGALKGSYPTAQNVTAHAGNTYGAFSIACVECHNPMYDQTNQRHIRSTITGSLIPATITFTAFSGPGSFADGAPYPENICETCHSQTNHHQADGIAPGGQDHENSNDCLACHTHNNSFLPGSIQADAPHDTLGDCYFCHVGGNFTDTIPNSQCEQCHTALGSLKGSYPTAQDVATHQSRECVECHDPMYGQTNLSHIRPSIAGSITPATITFTAYTGAGSFSDGAPYEENVCDTCHSIANHHQSDGVAPGGQDHKNSTDCRTCHDHIDGFSTDPALTTIAAPHDTVSNCTYCHVGSDYETAIPDSKCNQCHSAGGALKGSYPTAQDVLGHTDANGSGGYTYTNSCIDCHNPMYDQTNLKHIRSTITGSIIPATISFTATSGAGSYSDGAPYEENVCSTCHSLTLHHQADGTAPNGQSHNDGQNCASCHLHSDAFLPTSVPSADAPHDTVGDCYYCHVNGTFVDPIPNAQCAQCHSAGGALKGSYPTAQDVATHQSRDCVECHDPMYAQTNLSHVRSTITGSITPATITFTAYTGAGSFSDGAPYEENICDTCHSTANHHQSDGVAPGGQSHKDSQDCRSCHAHGDGFSTDAALTTISAPHDTIVDCTYCHIGTDYEAAIADTQCEQCHTAGGALKGSYPTAQNVLGHTDANGSGSYTYTNGCVDCHNVMYDQTNIMHVRSTLSGSIIPATITLTSFTGAGSFSDGAPYEENVCDTCHSQTLHHQADGTAPNGQNHQDSENCTGCHAHDAAFMPPSVTADAPHDTITQCTYCHIGGSFANPISNAQCEQCHTAGGALKGSYPTAQDVGTHQSRECVECHDPMNTQTNMSHVRSTIAGSITPATITFTAYTDVGSFSDGAPYEENICDTCHSTANHHQSDGVAPGGQDHKNSTDCRTCHAHIDGFSSDPALATVSAPHDTIVDCTNCHNGTDYEAAVPDSKCDQCHTAGGALKGSYPTAPDVTTHAGSTYGAFSITCIECHNPMYDSTNLSHIRSTMSGSIVPASNIVFTAQTGAGSAGDGAPYNENVCNTCHSLTQHHQSDGTAPSGQSHNDSQNCSNCHLHADAFMPTAAPVADAPHDTVSDCYFCHTGGTFTDPIPNSQCEQCHTAGGALKGSYPTAQDVGTHQNRDCVECHDPMYSQTNLVHVRSAIAGSIVPASNIVFTSYSGAGSFGDGAPYNENICDTCHSTANHHQSDGAAPGGQDHKNSLDCRTCHAHNDGFSTDVALTTVSGPHNTVSNCDYCHIGTDYEAVIPDSQCDQCHTAGGALKGSYPTAQDVLGHTDANGSGGYTYTYTCVDCHDPMYDQANLKHVRSTLAGSRIPASNIVFTSYTGAGSLADGVPHEENVCETCHSITNFHRYNGSTSAHEDGNDCTTCHGHDAAFLPDTFMADTPHESLQCNLCHASANYADTIANSQCEQCHTAGGALKGSYPTAPDVATHQSRNCVECHDTMNAQTNLNHIRSTIAGSITPATITFTAYTGVGSFSDGAPYEENLCDTCHSATNHHQSDGTAPGGQDHQNSLDCRTCHAHIDGFSSSGSLADPPHDSVADCNYCHDGVDYANPIPDSQCDQCHTSGGALKGSYPTAPNVTTHAGSTYGAFSVTCIECHNPMYVQTNLQHIRSTIAGSIVPASNVVFTAYTGAGSFADGIPYNENVCNTCHSLTQHHQSDGTAAGGQSHNDSQNCTSCHLHSDAFMPSAAPVADAPHDTVGDCNFCHVGGDYVTAIPNSQCEQCHTAGGALKGSYPTAQDVATHQSRNCVECHDPMYSQTNLVHVRSTIAGSIVPASNIVFTTYSGAGSFGDGAPYNENICDTCHGSANHHQSDGAAPGGQSHKDGLDCRTCHAHNDGFSTDVALTTVSGPHDTVSNCDYCHIGTNYETVIPDSQCEQCHTAAGALKGSYPTAQNVLGHTDANGSGGYTYTNSCVDCHNPMYDQTNLRHIRSTLTGSIIPATITFTATSGAGSHSDGAPYEENVCSTCHSLTLHHQADGTAPNGQSHNDGQNCASCHLHSDAFLPTSVPPADAPHDTVGDCYYCHTGGTFTAPIPNSQCEQCHTAGGALKGSYPTAQDVATHQSRNCVECHDPMYSQTNLVHVRSTIAGSIVPASNIVFTAYSGAGSFGDGAAYNENICDTCHSTANHHQSDGAAPGGQSHKDGQDCRSCHAHGDGFSTDAALITVSGPHDTVSNCDYCHVGTNYETVIPDNQCEQCHTAAGALKGSYPTAQNVLGHTDANGSGGYTYTNSCVDCHNPMYDQTNLRHIRSTLTGSIIPATITFTATSGAGSHSDGAPYEENVCSTCHSLTLHHQADGTAPNGQSHNDGQNCASCHLHSDAFLPTSVPPADAPHDTVGDCYYCHTGGTFTAPIPNSQCEQCHTAGGALKGSYPTAQDVATHQSRNCVECHDPMYSQTNLVHVRSTIAGSIVPASNIVFTTYSGAGSFGDGAPYNENICDTCHGSANHHQSDGAAPGGQSHKDGLDCRTCHAHNDGFSTDVALTTVSGPHDTVSNCDYCHIGTNYETVIPDSQCEQCHTAAGALKGSYPTAQNVLGHTDANGSGGYTYTNSCVDCHNPMYDQTNLRHIRSTLTGSIIPATITFTATSGAGSHSDGAPYEENVCSTCHSLTLHHQADGTAPNGQSHNDGQNCASCHLHSDAFLPTSVPPADAPHDTVGDCYYCHTGGTFTAPIPNSQCEQCHTAGGALKGSYPTAQDVATHQSRNCVECHDPMYSQTNLVHVRSTIAGSIVPASNIVFTAYSGAGSFGDGAAYNENICDTCHSTANHHQSDGAAPGGQSHKDGQDCRSCHAHGDGFSTDAALITVSGPHDTVSNCDYCHVGTNYETVIPDNQCEQCHTAAGALKGSYPTAQNVLGHTDANGSGGYTYTNSCVDCHNPMYDQTNLRHIRSTLTGSIIPATITFTATSGAGSHSDGAPYEENVCSTCHSLTLHHQADGTAPNGQSHNDGQNCASCHLHSDAFLPTSVPPADAPHDTVGDCYYCHTGGTFTAPIPNSQCEQCHTAGGALKGSYPTAQDVATHQSRNCVECHDPMYSQTNLVHVRSTIAGSIVPASNIVFTTYSGAGSFGDGAPYNENICDTCHGSANHHQSDGAAPGGQSHKDGLDCRTCHAHNDGFSTDVALTTVSGPHDTVSNCDYCHIGTNYETVIPDSQCEQCHTAAGALKGSYPTAQNVLGHTDANGSGGYTYTNSCVDCHNPMYDQTNLRHIRSTLTGSIIPATITFTATSGAGSHSDGAPYEENVCSTCHSLTLHHQADGTAPNGQSHNDGQNCASCHLHSDAFLPTSVPPADAPHDTVGDCYFCHVNGTFVDPIPNSQCEQCHTAGGALKGSYPTAQDVATHQSRNCVECHDPMYAQTNLVHVRSTIAGSVVPASNIVFTAYSGAGSFADGVPYEENVCDTCHGGTNHHQWDGTAPGGQSHNDSQDCRTCHAHIDGFTQSGPLPDAPHDTVADCYSCHVGGNFTDPIPDSQCNQCHTVGGALKGSYPTAQDVLGHTDANGSGSYTYTNACIDCHDPMYSQTNLSHVRSTLAGSIVPASNILFTAVTGAGSFADGAPFNENVCDTCHSATNHHQSDGAAPGGQSHKDGTDCRTCHAHADAYLADPALSTVSAPHDTVTDCAFCHIGTDYEVAIPNSQCDQCHTIGGALKGSYPTAQDVATHQSGDCVDCHEPMYDQTNLVHVRSTISGSITPATITFTAYTGAGSFSDGAPYTENVCDTCHSTANHHQSDGAAPGGQDHQNSTDCRTCHAHIDGFSTDPALITVSAPHDTVADCAFCHIGTDYEAAIPNSQCDQCHTTGGALKGSYPTAQDVATHQSGDCVDCHEPMYDQTNLVHVRSTISGSITPATITFTAYTGAGSFSDGAPYTENVCDTCHSTANHHQSDGTAPGGQDHQNSTDCRSCHDHIDGFSTDPALITVSGPHDTVSNCDYCHFGTDYEAAIPDSKCDQCHTTAGTLKGSYPTAQDVITHSDASPIASGSYTYSFTCLECHEPMYDQTNQKHVRDTLTGSILPATITFTSYSGAGSFADGAPYEDNICETCHTQTNHHLYDGSTGVHNDSTDCTSCHAHIDGFVDDGGGGSIPAPHDQQSCASCHILEPDYATPVTNSECQFCHDASAPGSNGVGWGDCRTETGTTNILSGSASRNVSLTTPLTDTTKAFLLVDSAGPQATEYGRDHTVSGYIAGTNSLTFEREGTTGQAEVSYALIECFYHEFNVQRGEIQLANGIDLNTQTLGTPIDLTRSMVIVNARTNVAATEQHQASIIGQLLSATEVEVKRAATAATADTFVRYEVVEFGDESGVTIQKAEFAFNGNSFIEATLPTSVNMDSTWLYFTYWSDHDGPQQTAISGQLTNINKVDFYRYENMAYNNRIRYYVVSFPAGQVTVQRGSDNYLGGGTAAVTYDIPISPVSALDKAFSFVTNTTADRGDGGTVMATGTYIEAENYSSTIAGTGTLTEVSLGGELSGGTSLQTGGSSSGDCDSVTGGGHVGREYMLNFPTAGTYNIWMRAHAFGNSSNTMFLGFYSGTEPADGCIAAFEVSVYNVWTWTQSMDKNSGPGGVNPPAAQFTVSTPGTYPIRLWTRENLNAIDGIFVDTAGNTPSDINHGVEVDPTQGTSVPFPRNRWTEVLTSTTNLQMANWRGDSAGADADFDWQVMDFTGTIGGGGGSDLKVVNHYGSTYGPFSIDCVECHNPMSAQSNLAFIRSSIGGNTVVFTAYTGTNSFADGDATNDGICEVCHTQTNFHRNDGTEPVQSHNNGDDCTLCHKHIDGYTPVVTAQPPHDTQEFNDNCTYCHVDDINYGLKIPNAKCDQCHTPGGSLKGGFPTAPDVLTHDDANVPGSLFTYSFDCVDCHEPMWESTNLHYIRKIIAGSIVPNSNIVFTALTGQDSYADGAPYEENVCDTCHSLTNHHQSDGTAPAGQSHNDGLHCAGCHPHGEAFAYSTSNCLYCHNQSPPFNSSDPDRRQTVENIPGDGGGDFVRTSHHVRSAISSQEIVTPDDCNVCHDQSQHWTFGDGVSVLLTDQDTGVSITYDGTGKSLETFCISCHDSDGSTLNGAQPFIAAGDTNSPIDIGWTPDVVSHSTAGTNEACFNCHGDEAGNASGHGSDNPYIHKYTFVPGQSHLFCYNCHDGSVSSVNVLAAFDLPFSHRVGSEECKACHDQHNAEPGLHIAGSENLADMIGGVNKGMGFDYQYEICFQCHAAPIAKTDLRSENDMDTTFGGGGVYASNWSTIPDVQSQFSTGNYAYHPLFAAGRNQPGNSLNSLWNSSDYRKDDGAAGGPFDGLDNNFVDGWKSTSLVTCSDCHGNGTATGARGIHGSDYAWLSRRLDNTTNVQVTTAAAGVIYPNVDAPSAQAEVSSTFCVNCHRADVYGYGSSDFESSVNNNEDLSRVGHRGGWGSESCNRTNLESNKGGFNKIGCANCHGGGEVAGIHGTNYGVGSAGSDEMGKRFMNGNSWDGHTLADTGGDVSCYTGTPPAIGQNLSSCTQHPNGRTASPNYYYPWQ